MIAKLLFSFSSKTLLQTIKNSPYLKSVDKDPFLFENKLKILQAIDAISCYGSIVSLRSLIYLLMNRNAALSVWKHQDLFENYARSIQLYVKSCNKYKCTNIFAPQKPFCSSQGSFVCVVTVLSPAANEW